MKKMFLIALLACGFCYGGKYTIIYENATIVCDNAKCKECVQDCAKPEDLEDAHKCFAQCGASVVKGK